MSMFLVPLLLTSGAPASATEPSTPPRVSVSPPRPTAPSEPFRERPLLLELQIGIATPTGLVGAYLDYAVVPALSLAAGVGTNLEGVEGAAEVRVRALIRPHRAYGFMVGYSAGPHRQTAQSQYGVFSLFVGPLGSNGHLRMATYRWELSHWANAALFFEERRPGGFNVRVFAGPAVLLNPGDARASEAQDGLSEVKWEYSTTMIFAGLSMGFAL